MALSPPEAPWWWFKGAEPFDALIALHFTVPKRGLKQHFPVPFYNFSPFPPAFISVLLRLRLHWIGYVPIRLGSDHYGTDPLFLHGTGSKLELYGSIWDRLDKWTHLVPDSRSDPYRIHQVPCKHKAFPYQFRIGSKRMRSDVNAA